MSGKPIRRERRRVGGVHLLARVFRDEDDAVVAP